MAEVTIYLSTNMTFIAFNTFIWISNENDRSMHRTPDWQATKKITNKMTECKEQFHEKHLSSA